MKYSLEQAKNIVSDLIQVNSIEFIGYGNHSEAFCINGDMVLKLPKHHKASECLKIEMQVLQELTQKMPVEIPNVLFNGTFLSGCEELVYFVSKRLNGKNLTKEEFLLLDEQTLFHNAAIIAEFLYRLHSEKNVFAIKKDLVLLHGDLSLNHILFNDKNLVCGILDFADSRVGKPESDFVYLLDEEDTEEFGTDFGKLVLSLYKSYKFSVGERNFF